MDIFLPPGAERSAHSHHWPVIQQHSQCLKHYPEGNLKRTYVHTNDMNKHWPRTLLVQTSHRPKFSSKRHTVLMVDCVCSLVATASRGRLLRTPRAPQFWRQTYDREIYFGRNGLDLENYLFRLDIVKFWRFEKCCVLPYISLHQSQNGKYFLRAANTRIVELTPLTPEFICTREKKCLR